jgi:imidazolonepropionase
LTGPPRVLSPLSADFVLTGAGELVTVDPRLGDGPLGVIRAGALAALDGEIVWVGRSADLAGAVSVRPGAVEVDAVGRVVLPGFVDSHTHLCFAGSREDEFARRVAGATYQEIAATGGGILSTVRATRAATVDELVTAARSRLDLALRHGSTTIEVKSGYGLTTDDELKMLETIRRLPESHLVEIHAIDPPAGGRPGRRGASGRSGSTSAAGAHRRPRPPGARPGWSAR